MERADGNGAGRPVQALPGHRQRSHPRPPDPAGRPPGAAAPGGAPDARAPGRRGHGRAGRRGVRAHAWPARCRPGDSQRSLRTAMHAIADTLTAHGFAAHAEDQGATTAVVADNCPFGDAASQYPVLCAVDRGMVKGLLAGLCGDDPAGRAGRAVVVPGPGRRRLRRRGLTGRPWPATTSTTPPPPRCAPRPGPPWPSGPTSASPPIPAGSTPRGGWSGPPWRTPATGWPTCSACDPARWSSPRGGPRRSTRPSPGIAPSGARGGPLRRSGFKPTCERAPSRQSRERRGAPGLRAGPSWPRLGRRESDSNRAARRRA